MPFFFFSGITTGKVALDPVNNLLPKLLQEPIIKICGSLPEDTKAGGEFGGSGASAGEGEAGEGNGRVKVTNYRNI